jgi:hypothetical protein|tara:strand:+ start:989 stop:1738 length:750 start_codon:yes stop_codon:yes gene_type:complete
MQPIDLTIKEQPEHIERCVAMALDIQSKLANKMSVSDKFVSLGQNCSSAWYLKQLGLKLESYPFDWIFSSPDIVTHCINDEFAAYLNKSYINDEGKSAGHSLYHSSFFNHRSPLKSEGDYHYYQRCCERFEALLDSQETATFLITLINEPAKRQAWAKGFDMKFPMPTAQSYESCIEMIETVMKRHPNSQFIIVDHYTQGTRAIKWQELSDNSVMITFTAKGTSTGVFYTNPLDDFLYKLMFTGLVRNR